MRASQHQDPSLPQGPHRESCGGIAPPPLTAAEQGAKPMCPEHRPAPWGMAAPSRDTHRACPPHQRSPVLTVSGPSFLPSAGMSLCSCHSIQELKKVFSGKFWLCTGPRVAWWPCQGRPRVEPQWKAGPPSSSFCSHLFQLLQLRQSQHRAEGFVLLAAAADNKPGRGTGRWEPGSMGSYQQPRRPPAPSGAVSPWGGR